MGRYYKSSSPRREPRWLPLRYAATCKVCGRTIPVGESAFYDYAAKAVTCSDMPCCEADGLTREVWVGSPMSGHWAPQRTGVRLIGSGLRDPGEDAADRWSER